MIKLKAWLAKDLRMGARTFLYTVVPVCHEFEGIFLPPSGDKLDCMLLIPEGVPSDLTWYNSPREVEVIIKKKKKRGEWFRF